MTAEVIDGRAYAVDLRSWPVAIDVGVTAVTVPDTGVVAVVGDLDHSSVAARARGITLASGGVGPVTPPPAELTAFAPSAREPVAVEPKGRPQTTRAAARDLSPAGQYGDRDRQMCHAFDSSGGANGNSISIEAVQAGRYPA